MSEKMTEKELAIQQDPFMAMIQNLTENPDVSVEKLKQIMDMQEHIMDKNAELAFNASMVQAQKNMPIVPKDTDNKQTQSKYSSYDTILKYCAPVYTSEGFALSFYEGKAESEGDVRVFVDIMHEAGHTKKRYVDIPIDIAGIKGSVNKTGTHAKGSTFSYGRSYLVRLVFNIPTGDDDNGNTAGSPTITEEQENELHSLITENKVDAVFVKWLLSDHLQVGKISEIPAKLFTKAKVAIQGRIKALNKLDEDKK